MNMIFNHSMGDAAHPFAHLFPHKDVMARSLGLTTHPGRALCMTYPGDVLQLPRGLKREFSFIAEHYAKIGLVHTNDIVWDMDWDVVNRYPGHTLSVFFFGDGAHSVRPNRRRHIATGFFAEKNACIEACDELGVWVPRTRCFEAAVSPNISGLSFPVYFKSSYGAGGFGVVLCKNPRDVKLAFERFGAHGAYQLQEAVSHAVFLSVLCRVCEGRPEPWLVSEQIIKHDAHVGNSYPTTFNPWPKVRPLAAHLVERGLEGVFGIDMAYDPKTGHYYVLEINPRETAASFPAVVAEKLGLTHWYTARYLTRHRSLATLKLGDLAYTPKRRKGVVIVDWGTIKTGSLFFLIVCKDSEQKEYDTRLKNVL